MMNILGSFPFGWRSLGHDFGPTKVSVVLIMILTHRYMIIVLSRNRSHTNERINNKNQDLCVAG